MQHHPFPSAGVLWIPRQRCYQAQLFYPFFPTILTYLICFSVLHPQGLTSTFATQILERDGPNELKPPKGTPEYVKFARQLAGGLQCLMWVAAVICFIAFGIELARGNLTSFDNVSYFSTWRVSPLLPFPEKNTLRGLLWAGGIGEGQRDKRRKMERKRRTAIGIVIASYLF